MLQQVLERSGDLDVFITKSLDTTLTPHPIPKILEDIPIQVASTKSKFLYNDDSEETVMFLVIEA